MIKKHVSSLVSGMMVVLSAYLLALATNFVNVGWPELLCGILAAFSLSSLTVFKFFSPMMPEDKYIDFAFAVGLTLSALTYVAILVTVHLMIATVFILAPLPYLALSRYKTKRCPPSYMKARRNYYSRN